jgi:hypothetical protein
MLLQKQLLSVFQNHEISIDIDPQYRFFQVIFEELRRFRARADAIGRHRLEGSR